MFLYFKLTITDIFHSVNLNYNLFKNMYTLTNIIFAYKKVLSLQISVDLGVMAMKRYFTFPKTLGLEAHYQMV